MMRLARFLCWSLFCEKSNEDDFHNGMSRQCQLNFNCDRRRTVWILGVSPLTMNGLVNRLPSFANTLIVLVNVRFPGGENLENVMWQENLSRREMV